MLRPASLLPALLLGLALAIAPANAATESVDCDVSATDSADINAALDDLAASTDASKILNLSGTCTMTQTIEVRSFPNILIQGPATLTAGAHTCGSAPPPGTFLGVMLTVIDTRNLNLRDISIVNGAGVFLQDSSASLVGVSVTGSRSEGISVQGASNIGLIGGMLTGPAPGVFTPKPNSITNGCNNGLNIGPGSTASMTMFGTISGNGGAGVVVTNGNFNASGCCMGENIGAIAIDNNRLGISIGLSGGAASVSGGTSCGGLNGTASVSHNKEWGVIAQGPSFFGTGGLTTIEDNQTTPASPLALAYRSGIFAAYGSRVFVNPGTIIRTTVGGPGIWGDMQSLVKLGAFPFGPLPPGSTCTLPSLPNASITQNGAEGLRLTKMSAADGQSVVNIGGNTGNTDASCDSTSYLFGIDSGINKNKCKSK